MLELMIYVETFGQLLAILAGIWFVRTKMGAGAYFFLIGTVVSFIGISVFTLIDTPVSSLILDGDPAGEALLTAMAALGQLFVGIGGCVLAFRLMRRIRVEK